MKNFFIFAAILFSQNINNFGMLKTVIITFILFCMLSSGVYLINDIFDVKKDRVHPVKKNRPIASGKISVTTAAIIATLLITFSILFCFNINKATGVVAILYFAQSFLYSIILKNYVIIDVVIISFGFALRAIAGATAINVSVSAWLLMCITLLALFLALCKRRNEIMVLSDNAKNHRAILEEYTPEFLNQMISISASSTLIVYSLYTFLSNQTKYLMLTIPFVAYGIFRYLYLVYKQCDGGEAANIILKDKSMGTSIVLWTISVYLILYIYY
jgi:4-hydroxybenzoate polyprenyltransferase